MASKLKLVLERLLKIDEELNSELRSSHLRKVVGLKEKLCRDGKRRERNIFSSESTRPKSSFFSWN